MDPSRMRTEHTSRINKLITMPKEHWDLFYGLAMEYGTDHFMGMLVTINELRNNPIETTSMRLDVE